MLLIKNIITNSIKKMSDLLMTNLPKDTAVHFFVAAVIGGFAGASFKLLFEVVLGGQITHQREVAKLLMQYKVPLVSASDSLAARIENLLIAPGHQWFESSAYYRLSTLYVFCMYFALVEILNNKLLQLRLYDTRKTKRLYRSLVLVDKVLNNQMYFRKGNYDKEENGVGGLPKLICKALGELVIIENKLGEKECMSFTVFCAKMKQDASYKEWLEYLELFIRKSDEKCGNSGWDRLHLIQLALLGLSKNLDPKHLHSTKLSPKKTKAILKRIREPYARELFCVDVVRWCIPIIVEPNMIAIRRAIRNAVGLSPELGKFKRYYEYPKNGIEYVVEPNSRQLETPKGRRRFYKEFEENLSSFTSDLPYGVRVNIVVRLGGNQVTDDVLSRLPKNIADFSKNRTRPEWVSFVKEES